MQRPTTAGLLLAVLLSGAACNREIPMTQTPASGSHAASTTSAPTSRPPILGPEASAIDFERIARLPEPGLTIPRGIAYSPDGAQITFLQSESRGEHLALFAFDLAAGQAKVLVRGKDLQPEDKPQSREEELRRERQVALAPCRLFSLLRTVALELLPQARAKQIDFGIQPPAPSHAMAVADAHLMHEALTALLDHGFDAWNLNRVEADVDPRNTASLPMRSARRA